jgi:hypothetical protein
MDAGGDAAVSATERAFAVLRQWIASEGPSDLYPQQVDELHSLIAAEVERAVREEREACAKVVESGDQSEDYGSYSLIELAAAIRARQP